MTETQYPQVVLLASEYTKSIDVWSVGCILCELIGRKPIFTGKAGGETSQGLGEDHLDQIKKILAVLGTPTEAPIKRASSLQSAMQSARMTWPGFLRGVRPGTSSRRLGAFREAFGNRRWDAEVPPATKQSWKSIYPKARASACGLSPRLRPQRRALRRSSECRLEDCCNGRK